MESSRKRGIGDRFGFIVGRDEVGYDGARLKEGYVRIGVDDCCDCHDRN